MNAVDEEIGRRLAEVRARIERACRRGGRDPGSVSLVGASKGQPVERLLAAWRAGLRIFGENRVQEAEAKKPHLPEEAEWHLLGPLQSNKVRRAVELFDAVHSLDRPKIAHALEREAAARGRRLRAFAEVHLGGEASKHGFPAETLVADLAPLAGLEHVSLVGLMSIPPPGATPEDSRPWFRGLRELRDRLAGRPEWQGFPGLLSMGMSDDFEVAVEEGATHVRVGTALFGRREGGSPPPPLC